MFKKALSAVKTALIIFAITLLSVSSDAATDYKIHTDGLTGSPVVMQVYVPGTGWMDIWEVSGDGTDFLLTPTLSMNPISTPVCDTGDYFLWIDDSDFTWRKCANGVTGLVGTADVSGEANTASNLGAGEGLFAGKVVTDLTFKSLVAGTNITLSSDANTITINSTGGSATFPTTTKGDLIVHNGTTEVRLPVGADGLILKANSATATGVEWAAGGGGASAIDDLTDVTITTPVATQALIYNGTTWINQDLSSGATVPYYGAKVTLASAQSIPTGTTTTVNWTAETRDPQSMHSNSTNNSRITVPTGGAGYYDLRCFMLITETGVTPGSQRQVRVTVNGAGIGAQFEVTPSSANTGVAGASTHYLNDGDYVECTVRHDAAASRDLHSASWLEIRKVDTPAGGISEHARATLSVATSLANDTQVAVTFPTESYDAPEWHSTSSNTSRMTVDSDGFYGVTCVVAFGFNATGRRIVVIKKNGTEQIAWDADMPPSTGWTPVLVNAYTEMAAGDYLECYAEQESGTSLNIEEASITVTSLNTGGGAGDGFVGVTAYNTSTQSTTSGAVTSVTFNGEAIDSNGFHSTAANTDQFVVPVGQGGWYDAQCVVSFDANTTGYRLVYIDVNGAVPNGSYNTNRVLPVTTDTIVPAAAILDLDAGDVVRCKVIQTSGGALSLEGGASGSTEFRLVKRALP